MAKNLTTSSSDIYDFLKNRFDISNTVDMDGNPTSDPTKMGMFTFDFTTEKGSDLGTIVISLLDDADSSNSVKVYYGKDIADKAGKEFYDFLEALRKTSKVHMLGFDVRDVNRARVTTNDILPALKESKFGPLDGSVKTSVQPLENVKIIVKHSDRVPDKPGARSRRIHRIYLSNGNGERFLMPFKSLKASRAMARHIHNGGTPHDVIGQKIANIVDEISQLSKFLRHIKRVGNLDEVIEPVSNHKAEIKNLLGSLTSQGGYLRHKDDFSEPDEMLDEPLDEALISRMMVDEKVQDALPYAARAYNNAKHLRQPKEFEEFKKWINKPVPTIHESRRKFIKHSFGETSIPALREMPKSDLEIWLRMAKNNQLGYPAEPEAIQVAEWLLSQFNESIARVGIWVQCWNTDHEEHVLVWPNELEELKASGKISPRANRKQQNEYWFNGDYQEFRQFLVGRASV